MKNKSVDYLSGMTTGMVFISDIFESRAKTFSSKKLLRPKDIRLIISVIDAAIAARGRLCDVGPRGMNLVIFKDGHCEFKEVPKQSDGSR